MHQTTKNNLILVILIYNYTVIQKYDFINITSFIFIFFIKLKTVIFILKNTPSIELLDTNLYFICCDLSNILFKYN